MHIFFCFICINSFICADRLYVRVQILVEVLKKYLFRSLLTKNPRSSERGFFYPSRRLGISSVFASISRKNEYLISPFGAVYHHALACIFLRLDDILAKSEIYSRFCADDIQCFALMIYTTYAVIWSECRPIFRKSLAIPAVL